MNLYYLIRFLIDNNCIGIRFGMKKVFINLYIVGGGGGGQNAFSFLTSLIKNGDIEKYVVIVRKGSDLESFCEGNSVSFVSFRSGFISRIYFELFGFYLISKKSKPKAVLTLFGNSPLIRSKGLVAISGFARSNIIESKVDFWGFLPFLSKRVKKLKDSVILLLMRRSGVIVLETQRLKRLANESKVFGSSKLEVIEMAPSSLVVDRLSMIDPFYNKITSNTGDQNFKFLCLCGPHKNKNVHLLPPILKELSYMGVKVTVVTTMEESKYLEEVKKEFNLCGANIDNLGGVDHSDIPSLIEACSAIVNVSKLESFSNNWVEAWASKRLLICRESGYAFESCGDAALYVDLNKPIESAKLIKNTLFDYQQYKSYVDLGTEKLSSLPSADEKFKKYEEIIEKNMV